jgi:broad specificity phosphatase PhoE
LRRCLQTSIAAFEGNGIPIVPCDLIQESYAGYRPCDTGKPKSELEREFKGIDIDFDELDEDWYDIDPKISEREDTREPALRARLIQFLRWVDSRPEERIIVVGHKGIFRRMFPLPDYPIFKNAEVRLYPIDFNKPLTFPVTLAQSSVYDKAIPHVDRKPRVECGC